MLKPAWLWTGLAIFITSVVMADESTLTNNLAMEKTLLQSTLIFNTACARCHEGQCSGRMSFHMGKAATSQHIHRHGGELSTQTTSELFELLRYMKEKCAYYPIPVNIPVGIVWNEALLEQLRTPSGTAYFIPLGKLQAGTYRCLLHGLRSDARVCIEIVSSDFDFVCDQEINLNNETPGNKTRAIRFEADEWLEYYLRIKGRESLNLNKVELLRL